MLNLNMIIIVLLAVAVSIFAIKIAVKMLRESMKTNKEKHVDVVIRILGVMTDIKHAERDHHLDKVIEGRALLSQLRVREAELKKLLGIM